MPATTSNAELQFPLTAVSSVDIRITSETRQKLLKTFHDTFSLYEILSNCITEKGHFKRADRVRHPLIFYLGHTAVFYINKLVMAKVLGFKERIDPKIESLVAIGVDEMSWDDLLSDNYNWPSVSELLDYRRKARAVIEQVIMDRIPLEPGSLIDWNHPGWIILMGIEHERIHLETSSVLIRQLPLEFIRSEPSVFSLGVCKEWSKNVSSIYAFKEVPQAQVNLGRSIPTGRSPTEFPFYGWDNEFGSETSLVESFMAGETLISNADFYQFVLESGYSKRELWSEEGWRWLKFSKSMYPKFWVMKGNDLKRPDSFVLRLMLEETKDMPWDWPVIVNCLEAAAYCRWYNSKNPEIQARLPTEREYQRLLDYSMEGAEVDALKLTPFHSPISSCSNIQLKHFTSSCPVRKFGSENGFYDVTGNVWQWTLSTMHPFENFSVHPYYDDFTQPCFDDKHNLIKGGSWISTGNEATPYSRYAFRRHFYQHAGFRMIYSKSKVVSDVALANDFEECNLNVVKGENNPASPNPYESDQMVAQYCEFHFGPKPTFFPSTESFPVVVARICEAIAQIHYDPIEKLRVLDLGCAVGRSSIELAKTFDQVVGIDFSARFIQVAFKMIEDNGRIRYSVPVEGDIQAFREISAESLRPNERSDCKLVNEIFNEISDVWAPPKPIDNLSQRITFLQGDACNLPSKHDSLFGFNVVLSANLIDRLYEPMAFLGTIHERIVAGGFLVLLSPYTWLPEYTPKEAWIGGKKVDGENLTTRDGLEIALCPWFDLYKEPFHVPMVIRETERKHQHTFSECTIWRKR